MVWSNSSVLSLSSCHFSVVHCFVSITKFTRDSSHTSVSLNVEG